MASDADGVSGLAYAAWLAQVQLFGFAIQLVVDPLASARTWDQLHAALERERTLLLPDAEFLKFVVAHGTEEDLSEDRIAWYKQLLALLRRCLEIGIEPAMEAFEMPLVASNVDPEVALRAYSDFIAAHFEWRGRAGRAVLAVLEREQAALLTDTADRVLDYLSKEFPDENTRNDQFRTLLRRARQIGIDKAWREYIKTTQGKDWTWVRLFEVFEEWIRESVLGDGYSMSNQRRGSTIYEGYRRGRHFLEAHPELLDPDFFGAPLDAEIAHAEEYVSSYEKRLKGKPFQHPSLRPAPSVPEAPVYENSRTRILGLIEGQSLLCDAYARGGTPPAIRDAYVNAYGGLVVDVPAWIEEALTQLDTLQQSGDDHETAAARAALLRDTFNRANADPDVAPEVVVEVGFRLFTVFRADSHLDVNAVREAQIALYTEALKIYSREHYPHQWARIQGELGELYAQRVDSGHPDDIEQVVGCYRAALQVITRNVSHPSWDLTEHNQNWALMQNNLVHNHATFSGITR